MAAKCSRRNKLLVIGKQIATPEHYAAILCSWSIFMEKPAWHCGNCGLSTWFRSLLSKIFHFPTDYSLDENFETSQHFNIVKKRKYHSTIRSLPNWCYQSHFCWLQFQLRMLDVSEVSAEHLSSLWMTPQLQFEVSLESRPQTENEKHMEVTKRLF